MHKFNLILDIHRDSRNAQSYPSIHISLKTIFCSLPPKKRTSIRRYSFFPFFYLTHIYFLAKILSRFCYRAKITCSPVFIYVSRSTNIIGDNTKISKDSLRWYSRLRCGNTADVIRNSWYFIVFHSYCLAETFMFFAYELCAHLNNCTFNNKIIFREFSSRLKLKFKLKHNQIDMKWSFTLLVLYLEYIFLRFSIYTKRKHRRICNR